MAAAGYILPINIVHTGAAPVGTVVWAMTNGTKSTIFIQEIPITISSLPSTVASVTRYFLRKFSGGSPTGGVVLNPVPLRTGDPPSSVTARQLDTGLTTTGITLGNPMSVVGIPIPAGGNAPGTSDQSFFKGTAGKIELEPGEGLAISVASPTVVNVTLLGHATWSEE